MLVPTSVEDSRGKPRISERNSLKSAVAALRCGPAARAVVAAHPPTAGPTRRQAIRLPKPRTPIPQAATTVPRSVGWRSWWSPGRADPPRTIQHPAPTRPTRAGTTRQGTARRTGRRPQYRGAPETRGPAAGPASLELVQRPKSRLRPHLRCSVYLETTGLVEATALPSTPRVWWHRTRASGRSGGCHGSAASPAPGLERCPPKRAVRSRARVRRLGTEGVVPGEHCATGCRAVGSCSSPPLVRRA